MTFKLAEFLKLNLIQGFKNDSFNENQVSIFSMNYLNRGQITEENFEEIQTEIVEIKRKREEAEKNPPIADLESEEPTEENISEEGLPSDPVEVPAVDNSEKVEDLSEELVKTSDTTEEQNEEPTK